MPFLYSPGRPLSIAELSAARLDGVLSDIGDAFMPSDMPETSQLRALLLGELVSPRLTLCRSSAAWVHGAGSAPPVLHHLQRAVPERFRVPARVGAVFHDIAAARDEVIRISGVAVTTPARTIADMARFDRDLDRLDDLVHLHPQCLAAAIDALASAGRLPGKHAAVELLRTRYEEVTRYTS